MRRRWVAPLVAVLAMGGVACSSNSSAGPTTAPAASVPVSDPDVDAPPRVDLIAPAIAAVEAELGGPQEYFEINATAKLVNVWISLNDGTMAQNWLYFDGALTSKTAEPAQGSAFAASAVTFDPDTVLAQLQHDLPSSSIDLFVVEGGPGGSVRYTAVLTSQEGGQLQVILGPDGTVEHVEAGTDATAVSTAVG
ncbi:MAG: hypothetical protein QM733_14875 [Ilumatobacteraceae bacterium]